MTTTTTTVELMAGVTAVIGHSRVPGTDLRVIVNQAIRDGQGTVAEVIEIIEQAEADAAADLLVCDYETGREIDGPPSAELVAASRGDRSGVGAVYAERDEHGVWQYVRADESDRRDVRVVYVEG